MFTGIIESVGEIVSLEYSGTNISYWVKSTISSLLKVDQSVSHNGVCLTVEEVKEDSHRVTAIEETIKVTALQNWKSGDIVNLERSMKMNGRLDGHIVQGHVDTTATCTAIIKKQGSTEFSFTFEAEFAKYIIEKGSVTVNGISLTNFNVTENDFTVAIIPYTFEHTSIKNLELNQKVNIEFDVIGKYVNRMLSLNQ